MFYLQAIFTTLWTIWNYRNIVVHQGINPNPMDVILTGQNLSCRYKEAFSYHNTHTDRFDRSTRTDYQSTAGNWQLIIKVAGTRSRKPYRSGIAYEAITVQGDRVFFGAVSSKARTIGGALLEAVVEAEIAAKNQGFHQVLFLSDSRDLLQSFKKKKASDWLDNTRIADLSFLTQNGIYCDMILVPHLVVKDI